MELRDIVAERRSVRAFSAQRIDRETIEDILTTASRAPSAINLQPWEVTVVMNDERERLSRRLLKAYGEKQISCSPGNVKPLPRAFSARGAASFDAMKPFLDEIHADFNQYINEGSCNFYGAPVAIIISMDDSFSSARLVDIGIFLGYLILAAAEFGLCTCPIGLITAYEDEVKDFLNISENKKIAIGVALGHPDVEHPLNRFVSPRAPLSEFVRWF